MRETTVLFDGVESGAPPELPGDHQDAFSPRGTCVAPTRFAGDASSWPSGRGDTGALLNELVALAVRGDRRATEELLASVRVMVLQYCRARLGDRQRVIDSPEDVAQDICLAVLAALASYQVRGLSFRAFVYGIAAHKVTDAFRGAARDRSEPMADVDDGAVNHDGPEQRLLHAEQSDRLGRLLDVLSDRQREVLVLRVALGLSAAETAQVVRSTPGAVRILQHRALNQLRVALAREKLTRRTPATTCSDDSAVHYRG